MKGSHDRETQFPLTGSRNRSSSRGKSRKFRKGWPGHSTAQFEIVFYFSETEFYKNNRKFQRRSGPPLNPPMSRDRQLSDPLLKSHVAQAYNETRSASYWFLVDYIAISCFQVVFQVESTFPKERIHALTGCYFLDLDMIVLPASLLVKRINQSHRLLSAKRNKNFSSKAFFVSDKKAADGKERQLSRNESVFTPIGCLCRTLVHIVQETKVNN